MKVGPLLQIGGGTPKGPVGKIHDTLTKVAMRATELGRTEVAIAAVQELGKLSGSVTQNVSVSNSSFQG